MTSPRDSNQLNTTVFQSGNSQAVRIPKQFRLDVDRVAIRKVGQNLVIIPSQMSALDAIDLITADLPEGWADSLNRPADAPPAPVQSVED